jgi:hypothetical protein
MSKCPVASVVRLYLHRNLVTAPYGYQHVRDTGLETLGSEGLSHLRSAVRFCTMVKEHPYDLGFPIVVR